MSRLLLLNLEDFGISQDITKTIQPYKPFCICCLSREGPMFNLEKCSHSTYLDCFFKPELVHLKLLVCTQCHNILKKIQKFRSQILESCKLLLSGAFTDSIINNKKVNNLIVQTVVDDLYLPPEQEITEQIQTDEVLEGNTEEFSQIVQKLPTNTNLEHNFTEELQNESNMEKNIAEVIQNNLNLEQNFTHEFQNESDNIEHNFVDETESNSNLEQDFIQEFQSEPNVAQDFTNESQNNSNMDTFFSENISNEEQLSLSQNRFNKNIKTALEILERNNQSFVGLSSQLQFLNGEHLSFLETSLLSKEILTDIPLVPAKNTSTDFGNELINNSKTLDMEIDGTDKMFYDNLSLSPELEVKETDISEIISNMDTQDEEVLNVVERKSSENFKPKKKNDHQVYVRRVKLSHEELDRERVALAQAHSYSSYRFRCETCIVGFNFKENLDDHIKRKHGSLDGESVRCEICSQTIPTAGHVSQHYYRHYTRYECVHCHKKHHTVDEAIHHYRRQCGNVASMGYKVKKARIRRRKLKMKPSSVEPQ